MTSKIEWLKSTDGKPGYTINPVKGLCPVACPFCYARRIYKRFKWNPAIRYDHHAWAGLRKIPAGSHVFIGNTIDLFHEKTLAYLPAIMDTINFRPDVTFIFLTKCPKNLPRVWPDNCWVGVSATNEADYIERSYELRFIRSAVKFISFEPLLDWQHREWAQGGFYNLHNMLTKDGIRWLIIGQCTPVKASTQPKIEWIRKIVEAADKVGVPVFLKENLRKLFIPEDCKQPNALTIDSFWADDKCRLRQEYPKIKQAVKE